MVRFEEQVQKLQAENVFLRQQLTLQDEQRVKDNAAYTMDAIRGAESNDRLLSECREEGRRHSVELQHARIAAEAMSYH